MKHCFVKSLKIFINWLIRATLPVPLVHCLNGCYSDPRCIVQGFFLVILIIEPQVSKMVPRNFVRETLHYSNARKIQFRVNVKPFKNLTTHHIFFFHVRYLLTAPFYDEPCKATLARCYKHAVFFTKYSWDTSTRHLKTHSF